MLKVWCFEQRAALRCHGQQEGSEPGEELDFAFFAKLTASAVIGTGLEHVCNIHYNDWYKG